MKHNMEAKHTPGPWEVAIQYLPSHVAYYLKYEELSKEEVEANARLIASAPCLLEALKAVLSSGVLNDKRWSGLGAIRVKAEEAISRAEGRA